MSWWSYLLPRACGPEHPGGLELTARAASLCGFGKEDVLLDVACGRGDAVRWLRENLGCRAEGLDRDAEPGGDLICGDAQAMPFPSEAFSGVLVECALSQMADRDTALRECARVLRPGGRLALTDLYARRGNAGLSPLGRLETRETMASALTDAGLNFDIFENHTDALTALWAGAMLAGGADCALEGALRELRQAGVRLGYGLWIARKKG